MPAPRLFQFLNGQVKAVLAILTSSGAADADKIPALGSTGKLHNSFLSTASVSAGAGDASKIPLLGANGRLDDTMLPVGVGADTAAIVTSEALAAGDIVNIYNNGGVATARKADATVVGKEAHGFVLASTASLATATVYFEGRIVGLAGMTPGARQYLNTTPGGRTEAAPSTNGNVVQCLGNAVTSSELNFEPQDPIELV